MRLIIKDYRIDMKTQFVIIFNKKRIKLFYVVLFFILLEGCKKESKENNIVETNISYEVLINPNEASNTKLSDIFKIKKYVPLEVNDNSVFSNLVSVDIIDNLIVTLVDYNQYMKKVLCFRDDGKFLYEIGTNGEGPGEFRSLQDIAVNIETNMVYLLDLDKIIIYDLKGNHLKTQRLKEPYAEIETIGKDTVIMSRNGAYGDQFSYHLTSIVNGDKDKNFMKIVPVLSNGSVLDYKRLFKSGDDIVYLQEFDNSFISKIEKNMFNPYLKINFGDFNYKNNSEWEEKVMRDNKSLSPTDVYELKHKIWENNLVIDYNNYCENDNFIILSYFYKRINNRIILNKNSGEVYNVKHFIPNDKKPFGKGPYGVWNRDGFVFHINSDDDDIDEDFIKMINNNMGREFKIDEMSSPILVFLQ